MKPSKPYFNTTHLPAPDERQAQKAARGQESIILDFYKRNAGKLYTPSEIKDHVFFQIGPNTPITSVRRAITQLERKGLLVKTTTLRPGPHKKPEHCWTAATSDTIQLSLL